MRIVFWGTPDFATPPLRALIGEGFDVVGVVTQPDRPRGRSRSQLEPSPVKQVAMEEGIAVLQPEKPRGPEFVQALHDLDPDLSVVVAYGHILPREVIDLPRMGTLNIHASLLPALRGAAPIEAAIAEGFEETGVSIMRMVSALDAGPVIHVLTTPIEPDETGGELTLRLSELGATALIEALALMELGEAAERPQDDAAATYARKIERENVRVDWSQPADVVARRIRAYDPRPGAWSTVRGGEVRVFGARAITDRSGMPGEVLETDEMGVIVACTDGAVAIREVHPAGKRRMAALDWAQGRSVAVGDRWV
ncbi:MAG: methionyl-tRNA formyltransferase [Gemmatimonas sp.]|nr:methionyl-tRNA formyltransferase [Gemmatimonas sp.]